MTALEAEIRRLETEWNQFFAGRLPRLPWEQRKRVDALVKQYDRAYIQNTADRFRFNSIQSRYAKFCELWERQLSKMEGGRPSHLKKTAMPPAAEAPAEKPWEMVVIERPSSTPREPDEPAPPAAPPERVVRFSAAGKSGADDERMKELYERLTEARKQAGQAPLAYENVAALVKAQRQKFAAGGSEVAFQITTKDGKVSLSVNAEKKTDE